MCCNLKLMSLFFKGAHHVDFRSATKDDPEWLKELRRQEVEIIQGWIDQYYPDLKRTNKE
jgi:lysosomal Pro-X carboxypeptidase